MNETIAVRAERPADAKVISDVVSRAYADVVHSDHREQLMIERLRNTDAWIPALSLLAEVSSKAVGHILLTRADIIGARSSVATLALAPLSVVPEHQGSGVGKRLVAAARRQASELGFETILLIGIPSYYKQFGFEPLSRYPIELPFEAPDENRMILPFRQGALDGVAGVVKYAEGWLDH